jgi:single-strand DNA-binding protein
MASMNSVNLTGHLGSEPDLRTLPSGAQVVNLNVAVNGSYTTAQGERVDKTTWVDVAVWGAQAAACARYLHKGSPVGVNGTIETPRAYIDKNGVAQSRAAVKALPGGIQFLAPAPTAAARAQEAEEGDAAPAPAKAPVKAAVASDGDDADEDDPSGIPF